MAPEHLLDYFRLVNLWNQFLLLVQENNHDVLLSEPQQLMAAFNAMMFIRQNSGFGLGWNYYYTPQINHFFFSPAPEQPTETREINVEETLVTAGIKISHSEFNHLFCPISHMLINHPVQLNGHYYEKEAVTQWVRNHQTDPLTNLRANLNDIQSAPNYRNELVNAIRVTLMSEYLSEAETERQLKPVLEALGWGNNTRTSAPGPKR